MNLKRHLNLIIAITDNVVSENSLFYILYYDNISENDDSEENEQRLCGDIYRHYFDKHR